MHQAHENQHNGSHIEEQIVNFPDILAARQHGHHETDMPSSFFVASADDQQLHHHGIKVMMIYHNQANAVMQSSKKTSFQH